MTTRDGGVSMTLPAHAVTIPSPIDSDVSFLLS